MISKKVRDLTLIEMSEKVLVIAVDSCGGVGSKEMDELKVDPYYVGRFTARVVFMEILSTGAKIITITNGVMNEFSETGERILEGIIDELKEANIGEVIINGSSEENFETANTGVAITAVGVVDKERIKVNKDLAGLKVGLIGIPKVGDEIKLQNDHQIMSYKDIYSLLDNNEVVEIIPVGSKGIINELKQINYEVQLNNDLHVDINKSAGPATCALVFYRWDIIEGVTQIGEVMK